MGIVKELLGYGVGTAKNKFGCRILIRLLEHAPSSQGTVQLMEELLEQVGDLIRHEFGHYVIEAILEHGLDTHKMTIYSVLEQEAVWNVCSRNAVFVLDRALKQATWRSQLLTAFKYNHHLASGD